MPEFSAQHLAEWTGGLWSSPPTKPMRGFCVDSRQLRPEQVFVAIRTEKRDGHEFLGSALSSGASAAIVSKMDPGVKLPQLIVPDPVVAFQAIAREHRRRFKGRVIGISGSAGKTSTKDLLALLLGGTDRVLATEGNLNNHLGVPLTLTRLDSASHEFAVVEAGISAPGEMKPLAEMIEPDVSLITLIAPAHTEELGGLDGVAQEKAQLPAATRTAGIAVFSSETAGYPAFRSLGVHVMIVERVDELPTAAPVAGKVLFTLEQKAEETMVSVVYGKPPPVVFAFRRVSDGMAQNAVLAICAALWLGLPAASIQTQLAQWKPARLRAEIRRDGGRLLYLDCYNANPASMSDALTTFGEIAPSNEPRLYVIGCMEELGTESPAHHRALGRSLKLNRDDRVFVIGGHADDIRAGAAEVGIDGKQVHVAVSAEAVAPAVAHWRGPVFVKGSRRYQLEKTVETACPTH